MKRVLTMIAVLALVASVPVGFGADFNGDGTNDIAIFRPSTGLWAIRDGARVYFGGTGDEPMPGDYDGDGTVDIAIFRESTGLWAVNGGLRAYFGGSGDVPLAGIPAGGGSSPWTKSGEYVSYDGTVLISRNSSVTSPQLELYEQGIDDYARLNFMGATSTDFFTIAGMPDDTVADARMHIYYNETGNLMTFTGDGDVGIGTTTPSAKLHVVCGTSQIGLVVQGGLTTILDPNIMELYDGGGTREYFFTGAGAAYANNAWATFSPYISMHLIPEDGEKSSYQVGDVIAAVDRQAIKTTIAYDSAVVGVICPPEGFISIPKKLKQVIIEEGKTIDDFNLVPVAYLGNVQVKVNNEGGPIRSGDLIVPSSVPGVAMKGHPESFEQYASVIGKAREDFEEEQGLVWVSVGVK